MPIALFKKKAFFTKEEALEIVAAIREAERQTSGEIRLFVETKCAYIDPLDKAKEVFTKLNMHHTELRNGVLVYVATKDRQMCVYGDSGIHAKLGEYNWDTALHIMKTHFAKDEYVLGLQKCVTYVGQFLHSAFPYTNQDKNELPDDIVFGN